MPDPNENKPEIPSELIQRCPDRTHPGRIYEEKAEILEAIDEIKNGATPEDLMSDEEYEKMSDEERQQFEDMIKQERLNAVPYDELMKFQRRWNAKYDPQKVKAKSKRRKANKAARASRKANRKKKK